MRKLEPGTQVFDTISKRKATICRYKNKNFIVIALWIDNKTENKYYQRRKLDELTLYVVGS